MNNSIKLFWIVNMLFLFYSCKSDEVARNNISMASNNSDSTENLPVLPSANSKFNSITSFLDWYLNPTSGNVVYADFDGCNYELRYKPELVLAFDRLNPGMTVNNSMIDDANKLIKDSGTFVFHLKITGELEGLVEDYDKNLQQYFGYDADKDFIMVCGNDTLSPVMFHYENTYPQLPYLSILLAFPKLFNNQRTNTIFFNRRNKQPVKWTFYNNVLFYQPTFTKINELWR